MAISPSRTTLASSRKRSPKRKSLKPGGESAIWLTKNTSLKMKSSSGFAGQPKKMRRPRAPRSRRSRHEQQHRKDLGKNRSPRFVQLFHWEISCPAYKDLSANARAIYTAIKFRYNGRNNGSIPYSNREAAEELKIGKSTAARAFQELVSHGFIVAEQKGSYFCFMRCALNPRG